MTADTVIKNCRLARHDGIFAAGIAVNEGKIVALARDEDLPPARSVINARGNYVLPGLVDAHVHLGIPPDVDRATSLRAETQACALGGVTTAIHLIHTGEALQEAAQDFIDAYQKNGFVDLALTMALHTPQQVDQLQSVADFGILGFKFSLPYRGSENILGFPPLDDGIVYLGFQEIGRLARQGYKVHARVHCENVEIFFRLKERFLAEGVEPAFWHDTRPNFCEAESMLRCIYLAHVTDCPLYVVHMTIREGVDIVARARAEGVKIIAETCPQYLVLNVDNVDRVLSKVNPPIRHREDNEALWQGIKNGVITVMGTDHAPRLMKDKAEFWSALVGMGGVEAWLPVMLSEGVNKGKISLVELVQLCSYNASRIYGLAPAKGVIEVGSDADLVIVDLNQERLVGEKPVYSLSDFSPVKGWRLKGWPVLTMLRGSVVMQDGKVTGQPGQGRYVAGLPR